MAELTVSAALAAVVASLALVAWILRDTQKHLRIVIEKVLLRDAIAHDQLARNRILQENLSVPQPPRGLGEPPPAPHVYSPTAHAQMLGDPPQFSDSFNDEE